MTRVLIAAISDISHNRDANARVLSAQPRSDHLPNLRQRRTAMVWGYFLFLWLSRRGYADLPPQRVGDFITGCALFGVIIGGRLGYVLFYKPEMLREPLSILRVWEGGMSSHGGMFGLLAFTFYYAHRHKISWTNLGDNLVVTAPIGLFFGRCANFINGELYGRITNVPWAMQFPKELLDH